MVGRKIIFLLLHFQMIRLDVMLTARHIISISNSLPTSKKLKVCALKIDISARTCHSTTLTGFVECVYQEKVDEIFTLLFGIRLIHKETCS
jgi:hypothetical protein